MGYEATLDMVQQAETTKKYNYHYCHKIQFPLEQKFAKLQNHPKRDKCHKLNGLIGIITTIIIFIIPKTSTDD